MRIKSPNVIAYRVKLGSAGPGGGAVKTQSTSSTAVHTLKITPYIEFYMAYYIDFFIVYAPGHSRLRLYYTLLWQNAAGTMSGILYLKQQIVDLTREVEFHKNICK